MSIALDFFCLTVDLNIYDEVELSVSIGFGGFCWTSYSILVRSDIVVCTLFKSTPSSYSTADATT